MTPRDRLPASDLVPAWQELLQLECESKSQRRVAELLGVSTSVVCEALKGRYKGDLVRLAERIEGAFGGLTVECPVLGEIPRNECLDHQAREFHATNWQRVLLFRTCNGPCPHGRGGEK